eukprot:3031525-Prymnesium_polylepis.1
MLETAKINAPLIGSRTVVRLPLGRAPGPAPLRGSPDARAGRWPPAATLGVSRVARCRVSRKPSCKMMSGGGAATEGAPGA